MPLADRLFLGGVRNLLAGAASVLHQHPDHRSLARRRLPGARAAPLRLRALAGADARAAPDVPHAATAASPGSCAPPRAATPRCARELGALAAANVLRQNTVVARGRRCRPRTRPCSRPPSACLAWCPEADLRQYGRTRAGRGAAPRGRARRARQRRRRSGRARPALDASPRARVRGGSRRSGACGRHARLGGGRAHAGWAASRRAQPADLLVTDSAPERLLAGDRGAVDAASGAGRGGVRRAGAARGRGRAAVPVEVDGERDGWLEPGSARRLGLAAAAPPALRANGLARAAWRYNRAPTTQAHGAQQMRELQEILSAMAAQRDKVPDSAGAAARHGGAGRQDGQPASSPAAGRGRDPAAQLRRPPPALRGAAPLVDLGSIPLTKRDSIAVRCWPAHGRGEQQRADGAGTSPSSRASSCATSPRRSRRW